MARSAESQAPMFTQGDRRRFLVFSALTVATGVPTYFLGKGTVHRYRHKNDTLHAFPALPPIPSVNAARATLEAHAAPVAQGYATAIAKNESFTPSMPANPQDIISAATLEGLYLGHEQAVYDAEDAGDKAFGEAAVTAATGIATVVSVYQVGKTLFNAWMEKRRERLP